MTSRSRSYSFQALTTIVRAGSRPAPSTHSALMFAALMIGHHFSISALW